MYSSGQTCDCMEWQIDTDIVHFERLLTEAVGFFIEHNILDTSTLRIIIRELLFNAAVHGNKNRKELLINCNVQFIAKNRIKIMVSDAGAGFDYRSLAAGKREADTGYPLLYKLAESITFNECGNEVIVIYHPPLALEEEIAVECIDNRVFLTLQAELTLPAADFFRQLLIDHFDKGYRSYTLDFKWVKQIDSMCISVLLSFAKMLDDEHDAYSLDIVNLPDDYNTLFNMMGFKQFFTIKEELKN